MTSKDDKKIKNALVALISTVIEWNLVDQTKADGQGVWNASAILADASIDGPMCSYSYSNRMKQLLYCPEMYGRLNMDVQSRFQSTYGLALYENCIRYQTIGQTPWFDLPMFRKLMGVADEKYIIFRDFKRRVLDTAIKEINLHAPIHVEMQMKRTGRNVVGLKFHIKQSKEVSCLTEEIIGVDQTLAERLRAQYGLSKKQVNDVRERFSEDYILGKIQIIEESQSFQIGKIKNLAKYLLNALEHDYQPTKTSREAIEKVRKARADKQLQSNLRDKAIVEYRQHQDKTILSLIASFSEKQKQLIEKEFETHIKDTIYFAIYKKQGLANVLVADKFCDFVRMSHKELLNEIMTFDEFCKMQESSGNSNEHH